MEDENQHRKYAARDHLDPSAMLSLKIQLSEQLYLRDPQESKLGKSIITDGIALMDEIGFEDFTFKKLASRMESTEASVYRYFSNKHLFLVYLSSYYWSWILLRIMLENRNITEASRKLEQVLTILVDATQTQPENDFVDMAALHRIVVAESTKVYHTKSVDEENRQGFFATYKALCLKISEIIAEIDPAYPYPRALATTLMEMAKDQIYFALHLPRLTDIQVEGGRNLKPAVELLRHFAFTQLDCKKSA